MQITVTVSDPTVGFQRKLLDLLAEHAGDVRTPQPALHDGSTWTLERARSYHQQLPPRARDILRVLATEFGGSADAEAIRGRDGRSLRGSTGAFRRILNEGARRGLWPAGMPVPVQSVTKGGKLTRLVMPGWDASTDAFQAFQEFFTADGARSRRTSGS